MGEKKKFSYESLQDPASIARYFEALARGFGSQELLFCAGTDELQLRPHGLLRFKVRARRKRGEVKVSLKVAWRVPRGDDGSRPPLRIRGGDRGGDGD